MKKTLVEIAKNTGTIRKMKQYRVTGEHIELFKAFANEEINMKQAAKALGIKGHNAYPYLLAIAKEMAR